MVKSRMAYWREEIDNKQSAIMLFPPIALIRGGRQGGVDHDRIELADVSMSSLGSSVRTCQITLVSLQNSAFTWLAWRVQE